MADTTIKTATLPTTPAVKPLIPKARFKVKPLRARRNWYRAMFYGPPGVGKTELIGTAYDVPWMRDILIADVDDGTLTISVSRPEIDIVPVTKYRDIGDIIEFIEIHVRFREADDEASLWALQKEFFEEDDQERLRKFNTFAIDTASELQRFGIHKILEEDPLKGRIDEEREKPMRIQDWGTLLELLMNLATRCRKLPINTLLTAHERIDNDETTNRTYRTLAFQGQAARLLPGKFDVVVYLAPKIVNGGTPQERREVEAYLQPRPLLDAKNRVPGMRNVLKMSNPVMNDLVKGLGRS